MAQYDPQKDALSDNTAVVSNIPQSSTFDAIRDEDRPQILQRIMTLYSSNDFKTRTMAGSTLCNMSGAWPDLLRENVDEIVRPMLTSGDGDDWMRTIAIKIFSNLASQNVNTDLVLEILKVWTSSENEFRNETGATQYATAVKLFISDPFFSYQKTTFASLSTERFQEPQLEIQCSRCWRR